MTTRTALSFSSIRTGPRSFMQEQSTSNEMTSRIMQISHDFGSTFERLLPSSWLIVFCMAMISLPGLSQAQDPPTKKPTVLEDLFFGLGEIIAGKSPGEQATLEVLEEDTAVDDGEMPEDDGDENEDVDASMEQSDELSIPDLQLSETNEDTSETSESAATRAAAKALPSCKIILTKPSNSHNFTNDRCSWSLVPSGAVGADC